MWYHAFSMPPLLNLCKTAEIIEQSGIHISKHIANRTVWDTVALENPDRPHNVPGTRTVDDDITLSQIESMKPHIDESTVLLDYGCGRGRIGEQLLSGTKLAGYIGLDSSYEMLKLFRERIDRLDSDPVSPFLLLNADINNPPLKSGSVDVALVAIVFQHNHKSVTKQAVYELARIVKPGGRVLVKQALPRVWSLDGLQGQLYQIALNLLGRPFKNGPVRYYTRGEIKRLFTDFSAIELVPVGFGVVPHNLLFLPQPLQTAWQRFVASPINTFLEKITPTLLRRYFATHVDVVARR